MLALLLHGFFFVTFNKSFFQAPECDVSSGDGLQEIEVEEMLYSSSLPCATTTKILNEDQKIHAPDDPDDVLIAKPTPISAISSSLSSPRLNKTIPRTPSFPTSQHQTDSSQHHKSSKGHRSGAQGNGKATYLTNPEPPYPEAAKDAQIEGRVEVMVRVNSTGDVISVQLVHSSGDLSLDQSALNTVRTRWKFSPAIQEGMPITSEVLVPIQFKLTE